ncbi:MAG: anti-sigma factor [Pseudomonadota bacterium]
MDTDPQAELPAELKQHMVGYQAPPGLKRRIRHMLEQQQAPAAPPAARPRSRPWRGWGWLNWGPLGASFACGALVAVSVMGLRDGVRVDGDLEQQVVAGHVRSLLVSHLTDVASTDQHTVKPWFAGKLDYAPPVIDLAEDGFPLVGGRLDYLQGRPVAALVYRRRGHAINVYVLPARSDTASPVRITVHQGWHLEQWSRQGMQFWAISDVGPEDLAKFVAALQAAT